MPRTKYVPVPATFDDAVYDAAERARLVLIERVRHEDERIRELVAAIKQDHPTLTEAQILDRLEER
jgi:hypothetical protein